MRSILWYKRTFLNLLGYYTHTHTHTPYYMYFDMSDLLYDIITYTYYRYT